MVAHSSNLFYSRTRDHLLTFVSPQSRTFLECEPDEALQPWTQFLTENPVNRKGMEIAERAIRTGQRQPPYELELKGRRGGVVSVEASEEPIVRDGATIAVVGSLTDITDRKRFEVALRESEQQFRQLLAGSPDAIVLIDPHDPNVSWPIVDCNEAACRMNGYRREEIIGRSIDAFNTRTGTADERVAYLERLRQEHAVSLETFHRRRDGHVFPVEVSTSLVTLGGRELVLGIDRDITERKRTEQHLRRAIESERQSVERLHELDKMKNAFLTAVSHELRTPLTSVLGSALTLEQLRATLSEEDQDELIHAISSNAQRLERMLADLLDLGRLTHGVVEAIRTPTDLAALVRRIIEQSGIQEDHVLHTDLDEMTVDLDEPKVERIVDNLLTNVRRHTAPGTEVWAAIRPLGNGVLLIVEDAGAGVPEADRALIFESFKQLGDLTPHSPGVGIGLALVSEFARLHGGRAWVEDRPGGGSSFKVFLSTVASSTATPREREDA